MKNKFILTVLSIFCFAFARLCIHYPKSIAIHPTEDILVIGHNTGNIIIVEKSTLKFLTMIKVCKTIEKTSFNKDGSQLWLFGRNLEEKDCALSLDSKTWTKKHEIGCYKATFSSTANKLCYKIGYSSGELKIADMSSAESVGSLKTAFTKDDSHVDFFEFSTDGSQIIMAESVFGDIPCEILIYPSEGFVAKPTKSFISSTKISTGFGTGISSNNNEHILIGWSETLKLKTDTCETLSRGYDFCHSFCSSADGSYFYIGGGGEATQYDFLTMKTVPIELEKIDGHAGNIIAIGTIDSKNYYFVTDDYIVGIINSDGFVVKQTLLNMTVDVILSNSYKAEDVQKINDACKLNKLKVVIPEIYDKEKPVKIAAGVSMSDASKIIEKMRASGIYCGVSLIQP